MTIDERLEGMAQTLELQISLQADAQKHHEARMAEHAQQVAEHEQRMAKLELSQAKTDRTLRWAIRLGVREARNERKRRQELAKGHQELEAMFKKFLERSGNGQH
jgi:hypothetical protein